MTDETAVSGGQARNAGEKANASLDAAFDKAFTDITVEDDKFAPAAVRAADTDETPTDTTVAEDAAATPKGAEGETGETPEAGEEHTPAEVAATVSPPEHWSVADREAFGKLTPDAQKLLLGVAKNLEGGFTKKSQELTDDRNFAQTVRGLVSPTHMQQLANAGMVDASGKPDVAQGIRHLMSLQDYATRDLPGYIRWVAAQGQLQPQQIFPQLAGIEPAGEFQTEQPAPADPYTQQLHDALQQISGRLSAWEQTQADTQNRQAEGAIGTFRNAKDEAGQPLYPHLGQVEQAMAQILTSDPELVRLKGVNMPDALKRAYELAVYRDPTIRSDMINREVEARMAKSAKQAELAKAKRAKAPINSGAPVSEAAPRPKNLDEAARQAMDALLG